MPKTGGVAERLKAPVLKTGKGVEPFVSSNLTSSAKKASSPRRTHERVCSLCQLYTIESPEDSGHGKRSNNKIEE